MTQVADRDFRTPAQINVMAGMSADRYLRAAPPSVSIIQICQDSNNPSQVIIDFSVAGAFYFTPVVYITQVDLDRSFGASQVIAPVAILDSRTSSLPIDTGGGTRTATIVADFGSVIPKFLSAQVIRFTLTMTGSVPLSYGISVPAQSPSVDYVWTKGVLPTPIGLNYNRGSVDVLFHYNGTVDCTCDIQCVTQSGVGRTLTFCPTDSQSVSIPHTMDGDPFSFNLVLSDGIGNISELNIVSVVNVNPKPPIVYSSRVGRTSSARNEVALNSLSLNGITITDVQYQVIKFIGSVNNYMIWKDWSNKPVTRFVDKDVRPGVTYGYAVRYKGRFNDVSNLSNWTVVTS